MNAPARDPTASGSSLRQRLGIETPEHVALHLELAGLGSRAAAALVDTAVATLGLVLLIWLMDLVGLTDSNEALVGWLLALRSEERRVGKACSSGRLPRLERA